MKKIGIFLLAAVLPMFADAQDKQKRSVDDFSAIRVSCAIKVVLSMDDNSSVSLEGDESDLSEITTEVRKGELYIIRKGDCDNTGKVTAYVSARKLNSLKVEGAAELRLTNKLRTEALRVSAAGAGELDLELDVKTLDLEVYGASKVVMRGKAGVFKIELSGASDLKASDLLADKVFVKALGASKARVNATEHIEVDAKGASKVLYSGKPKNKEINVSGASTVKED